METNPYSISIVEDEPELRSSLTDTLLREGYRVWSEGSAEQFYRHFSVNPTKLVFIDIGLPSEDGLSMLAHLSKIKECHKIVITADDSPDTRRKALTYGADMFITKPIDAYELLAIVRHQLHPSYSSDSISTATNNDLWVLDLNNSLLQTPCGASVKLTSREILLLEQLMTTPGQCVHKKDIDFFSDQALATCLSRVRSKVVTTVGISLPVRAIFGQGLVFSATAKVISL